MSICGDIAPTSQRRLRDGFGGVGYIAGDELNGKAGQHENVGGGWQARDAGESTVVAEVAQALGQLETVYCVLVVVHIFIRFCQ